MPGCITTLDVSIQDLTENALMKMMTGNEAEHGCAIVMEVKTGKVKAIANLGKSKDGSYFEDYNYAITPSEPGSTFKLATMLALLEDKKISLRSGINLEGGVWKINGQTVYDSEEHGLQNVTVKQAFEHSSNVGMAKLAWMHYNTNPNRFVDHLHRLRMDTLTGIDVRGEIKPVVYRPGNSQWSRTALPWMAFGYNLLVTPLQTLSLYNAVANNGVMMKPYLVNEISQDGISYKKFEPVVVNDSICSASTLKSLKECLEGVMLEGTGVSLQSRQYKIAGKTGTALVANGKRGYADKIYQSSFAGYFPADNPQYSIIVVIKNKPHALFFYGAAVAGPVFKEIADKIYALKVTRTNELQYSNFNRNDSVFYNYAGYTKDIKKVAAQLQMPVTETTGTSNYSRMYKQGTGSVLSTQNISSKVMPSLAGMGLKDAVYLCENLGLKVTISGKGKVAAQSIVAGQGIRRGQSITIQLS